MDLRYAPARILTGLGYDDTTRIQRLSAGAGGSSRERVRLIQAHPSPLGIQAVQVPSSPGLEVELIRTDEGGDETLWGPVRASVIGLWHEERGRSYKVPVELQSGQRLDLRTRNFGEAVEADVRVRGLRPGQLADYKQDVREDMGEVPAQAFASLSMEVPAGGAEQRIVTVPTGDWCFDRAYLTVTTQAPAPPMPSVALSMDERSLFDGVPFTEREVYFPLQRLRRKMKLSVSSSQAPLQADIVVPLYRSDFLLDQSYDTTETRDR